MNRYYVLTERDGLKVLDAATVDEPSPATIRFVSDSGDHSFKRHELLWWSAVESSPPSPISEFDRQFFPNPQPGLPGKLPWGVHGAQVCGGQRAADFGRLAAAALRALSDAVCSCVSPAWRTIQIELKATCDPLTGKYKVTHRLRNPDTGAEEMNFSDALFASAEVFHRIDAEGGQNWNESTVTIYLDEKRRCRSRNVKYHFGTKFGP